MIRRLKVAAFGIALGLLVIVSAYAQNSPSVANPTPAAVPTTSTGTAIAPARPPAETIIQHTRQLQQTQQRPAVSTTTVPSPPAVPPKSN
jgi:hypothetical protein